MALVERQWLIRNPVFLFVLPIIAAATVVMVLGLEEEPEALPWVLLPSLFFAFILSSQMRTYVEAAELRIVYWPLWRRTIPLHQVRGARLETFRPLWDHGGWGIRFGRGGVTAYTAHGRQGVRLHVSGHRDVVVGSQAPALLLAELEARGVAVEEAADTGRGQENGDDGRS